MLAEYSAKSILFVYISDSPFLITQGAAGFWKYTFCIYTSRHGCIYICNGHRNDNYSSIHAHVHIHRIK